MKRFLVIAWCGSSTFTGELCDPDDDTGIGLISFICFFCVYDLFLLCEALCNVGLVGLVCSINEDYKYY